MERTDSRSTGRQSTPSTPSRPGIDLLQFEPRNSPSKGFFVAIVRACWLAVAMCVLASPIFAQEAATVRQRHPWGRYVAGSWKHVRLLSEQFDDKGELVGSSTTETTTTLEKITDQTFTLR